EDVTRQLPVALPKVLEGAALDAHGLRERRYGDAPLLHQCGEPVAGGRDRCLVLVACLPYHPTSLDSARSAGAKATDTPPVLVARRAIPVPAPAPPTEGRGADPGAAARRRTFAGRRWCRRSPGRTGCPRRSRAALRSARRTRRSTTARHRSGRRRT